MYDLLNLMNVSLKFRENERLAKKINKYVVIFADNNYLCKTNQFLSISVHDGNNINKETKKKESTREKKT